jgi:Tol biopolymer transport system component
VALAPGTRLGVYEILTPIGAGGMGEVYQARDTRLKRDVALKVLPDDFAHDPDRLARFQREAELLATLNHPNIAAIYGLEESNGVRALVLELVEGPTLADRIANGPISLDDALPIARQIAEALEAAHEKGVIHRDLKPANIKLRSDGTVKVLDFGLAAVTQDSGPHDINATNSPTLTLAATRAGVIMGTAAYMSPEQASGKPVDKRADIWSFGVVLWEMPTGQRLFAGETISHTLADVLRAEIDFDKLPRNTPRTIRDLLRRSLDRDARNRLRDIGEARVAIHVAQNEPAPRPIQNASGRHQWPWMSATAVLAVIAAGLVFVSWRLGTDEARVLRLSAPFPAKAIIDPGSLPAVSPDGRRIAFAVRVDGRSGLWVRELDSMAAHLLPGTAGAFFPFWSPNGRTLGFFADGKLKRLDVDGGPVLTLCDAPSGRGGTWSKNDVIVFASGPFFGLFRVPAGGGSPAPVTLLDAALSENSHRAPWFLPDDRHFLYTARSLVLEKTAIYVGDLDSKTRQRVLAVASNAVYTTAGYLFFVREQALMAQPFDPTAARTTGDAIPVAEGVDYFAGESQGQFSVSQGADRNGVVAFTSGWTDGADQLTWFDRAGKVGGTVGAPGALIRTPTISPNGDTVAFSRIDSQTGGFDLWLHDLVRGTDSRFTSNARAQNLFPVWSPDGSHIAFSSSREGLPNLYQKSTGGVAPAEILDRATRPTRPTDWSRDRRYIVEAVRDRKTKEDVWVLPLFGDRKPFPYVQSEFTENDGKLSPNGGRLAYVSDESKRNEVFVQTFPTPGGKWQVSTNGGDHPVWSRDGRELFFIGADQKLMAVEVKEGPTFAVPRPLFETRDLAFDVSKDGRFLIPTQREQAAAAPMNVIVNWMARLRK